MKVNLLFEQSGTFKHALTGLGHTAKDYDIANMFNETDVQCDLFHVLDNCVYSAECFKTDLIIAFFPCTYFSNYNDMIISGNWYNYKYMNDEQKHKYMSERKTTQDKYFTRLKTLILICEKLNIPLIIENPVSPFMTKFITDNQITHIKHVRNKYGDDMRKPTYYMLFNGAIIDQLDSIPTEVTRKVEKCNHDNVDLNRSKINPVYVNNICKHIEIFK